MKQQNKKYLIVIAIVLMAVLLVVLITQLNTSKPTEIDSITLIVKYETDLRKKPNEREIGKIKIEGSKATAYDKNDKDGKAIFTAYITSEFITRANDAAKARSDEIKKYNEDNAGTEGFVPEVFEPIPIALSNPNSGAWITPVLYIVGIALVVGLAIFMIRQMSGGGSKAMGFGKLKTKSNENVKIRFNDVAGAEEEKEELKEIVEFLKAPKKFTELGARIPRGVLLVGPPGTGKTLFAKAIAGEANVPFFSISGSDFVEMFVGVGASRVRDLFETAKRNMPCIIFIDEIDAVGRQRGAGLGGGNDEREQTLNQLLVQMDGFDTNDGIIIIAATNRADILDPALLRPGRFDRQIFVNIPDVRGREAIFKVHARNKPLSPEINFKLLARMTSGFTGADIANLLNESAILAARANRRVIIMKDVYEGINKVIMGPAKKSRLVTESDKRITAYHESGHAILAYLLPHCDPVQEVSIIPRGMAAGYTMVRPDNDNRHESKNKMLDYIVMALGGRVAEELIIKDISAGASGDIQNITNMARAMVTQYGMSDLGPIYYGEGDQIFLGRDFTAHNTFSEVMSAKIDAEVAKIIDSSLNKAREMLKENLKVLDSMSRVLIEKETIYTEEVEMLMEGKSVKAVISHIDERFRKDNESVIKPEEILDASTRAEEVAPASEEAKKTEENPEIKKDNEIK